MNSSAAWIETFSGKCFHLLEPTQDEICIEDIAHALSMQARFTGHTKRFYSVAEHSYHVSLLCGLNREDCLWGLLHDASEAYITDLSRPVKYMTPIGEPYFKLEELIMRVIALKFGLPWPAPACVKAGDNIMLWTEKEQLMSGLSWNNAELLSWDAEKKKADKELVGWLPQEAEKLFLDRFRELQQT